MRGLRLLELESVWVWRDIISERSGGTGECMRAGSSGEEAHWMLRIANFIERIHQCILVTRLEKSVRSIMVPAGGLGFPAHRESIA